jgi:hypothetical protein
MFGAMVEDAPEVGEAAPPEEVAHTSAGARSRRRNTRP